MFNNWQSLPRGLFILINSSVASVICYHIINYANQINKIYSTSSRTIPNCKKTTCNFFRFFLQFFSKYFQSSYFIKMAQCVGALTMLHPDEAEKCNFHCYFSFPRSERAIYVGCITTTKIRNFLFLGFFSSQNLLKRGPVPTKDMQTPLPSPFLRSGHIDIKVEDVLKISYHIISRFRVMASKNKGRFRHPKIKLSSKVAKLAGKIRIDLIMIFCINSFFLCESQFLKYSQF